MSSNIEQISLAKRFDMSQNMRIPSIQFTVQSGRFAAREASEKLMRQLAPLRLDIEEVGTVEMVLAEALNNIVEHGYPDPENGGPISIYCEHGSTGLCLKLTDNGLPMPGGKAPVGMAADIDFDFMDLPEGGFGWFIIKDLAKDIIYTRSNNENRLDLRIALGTAQKN